MKPSNFKTFPWSSIFEKHEAETIACNIMVILSRTGDTWRKLEWEEYEAERLKDGGFSMREATFFNQVIDYTTSADQAAKFSKTWAEIQTQTA